MTERRRVRAAPRPAPRRPSLGRTALPMAAVATACAGLVWSALFYDAAQRHAAAAQPSRAVAPADPAQVAPDVAPVTTRTS